MTTEISTTPVTTDFSKANVLTFQDKVVLNDPSNFPENTDNFLALLFMTQLKVISVNIQKTLNPNGIYQQTQLL